MLSCKGKTIKKHQESLSFFSWPLLRDHDEMEKWETVLWSDGSKSLFGNLEQCAHWCYVTGL